MKTICYLSLGYPTLEQSIKMADAYMQAGSDGIEISLPCKDPLYERETIKNWMIQAYELESDYNVYFDAVKRIRKKYPDSELYVMVYHAVIEETGKQAFADFCIDAKINAIISANLTDDTMKYFKSRKVEYCAFGSLVLEKQRLEMCLEPGDIIYMQSKFRLGQQPVKGYETLKDVIGYMRKIGITRPIYCGGGIETEEDVKRVKEGGAQGFFVGTAIINHAYDLEKVIETVTELRKGLL